MRCQFPRCKKKAEGQYKGVNLCKPHHTAIMDETMDYYTNLNRQRIMKKSERSFRKLYYTIATLFKKPEGEPDG